MELLNTTTSGNTGTSPNDTSILKNPPICNNSDGQDDIASDETGSNSSAQGSTSSPSPPSSTVIAMRGMVGGSATSNGGGPQPQTLQRVGNGRRLHHSQSQGNVP